MLWHYRSVIAVIISTIALLWGQRQTNRKIKKMDQATQAAFDEANGKIDTLTAAVTTLATDVVSEKQALDAALAANNTADVLTAAKALSAKLDSAISTAQAALASVAPAPPAPPVG